MCSGVKQQKILDMHGPVAAGYQVWFAQPDALKGSLGGTLKEVRPTFFFGVPVRISHMV